LPTNYAYFSPLEAAPELLVSHGINEASRISFLQKTSPAARRWTEETDKKLVNAAKFHDKEQPLGGWVRIASGDIVPKAQGQSLVDIFNKKYAQKESKPS